MSHKLSFKSEGSSPFIGPKQSANNPPKILTTKSPLNKDKNFRGMFKSQPLKLWGTAKGSLIYEKLTISYAAFRNASVVFGKIVQVPHRFPGLYQRTHF